MAKMATSTAVRKIIVTQRTAITTMIDQCWITTVISLTKISAIKIMIGPSWIFTPADWPAPFRSSTAPMSVERSELVIICDLLVMLFAISMHDHLRQCARAARPAWSRRMMVLTEILVGQVETWSRRRRSCSCLSGRLMCWPPSASPASQAQNDFNDIDNSKEYW